MRRVDYSTKFRRDLKREFKGRYRILLDAGGELDFVVDTLRNDAKLPLSYKDHALHGEWEGSRDCHIRPDLLLVYAYVEDDVLVLERFGSHSENFGL